MLLISKGVIFMNIKSKACKVGLHITILVLIAQLVVFIALFFFINGSVTKSARDNAVNSMETSALDRSEIIMNYVRSSEDSLTAYLKAQQIYDLLSNPSDAEAAAAAQKYTEDYSSGLSNLEGIYASSWDTTTLTHTNAATIGLMTRKDEDARKPLHDSMLATDGVYNTGIIISPASQEQIISMYKAVKDSSGNPIGYGGIGIFTKGLVEKLNELPLNGMPGAEYYLVNANTGEYIFHPDTEKITTVADEQFVNDIIAKAGSGSSSVCDYLSYSRNGESYIAAYNSISDYGWVFIIADKSAEVFASSNGLSILLVIIFVVSAIILTTIVYFLINSAVKPVKDVENAIVELEKIHLDISPDLKRYSSRNDEIGSIAAAADRLCVNLKKSIDDVNRVLGEIANENLNVDTDLNKKLYIGDFVPLYENICTIKSNLVSVISKIYSSSDQVNSGSDQVAAAAQTLADGSVMQSSSIDKMMKNISDINVHTGTNAENCSQACELIEKTADYVGMVNDKMGTLTDAMNNINKSSDQIGNIMKTIEDIAFQTNILALNAAIEAARAGVAGKGFAVVADEVRNLSIKSSEAVQNTAGLIEESVNAVNNGVSIMQDTASAMEKLGEYTSSVKNIIEDIAKSNGTQSEMVDMVNRDIMSISDVVQSNSATAEECAAAAEELSGQSAVLKELVGKFNF